MSENLFKDLADAFASDVANFGDIYNHPEVQKRVNQVKNAVANAAPVVDIPMNLYSEEDGTYVFEVAIPGKTKENVKLSSTTEKGVTYLVFDVNAPELTDEEKAAKEKRKYKAQKISGMTKLYYKYPIPSDLDITRLSAKVQNGLLTVVVPVKEAVKPVEFNID